MARELLPRRNENNQGGKGWGEGRRFQEKPSFSERGGINTLALLKIQGCSCQHSSVDRTVNETRNCYDFLSPFPPVFALNKTYRRWRDVRQEER